MFARFSVLTVLAAHLSAAYRRVFWSLAFFNIAVGFSWTAHMSAQNAAAAQARAKAGAIPALEVGKPVELELAGGQSHAYQVSFVAG